MLSELREATEGGFPERPRRSVSRFNFGGRRKSRCQISATLGWTHLVHFICLGSRPRFPDGGGSPGRGAAARDTGRSSGGAATAPGTSKLRGIPYGRRSGSRRRHRPERAARRWPCPSGRRPLSFRQHVLEEEIRHDSSRVRPFAGSIRRGRCPFPRAELALARAKPCGGAQRILTRGGLISDARREPARRRSLPYRPARGAAAIGSARHRGDGARRCPDFSS